MWKQRRWLGLFGIKDHVNFRTMLNRRGVPGFAAAQWTLQSQSEFSGPAPGSWNTVMMNIFDMVGMGYDEAPLEARDSTITLPGNLLCQMGVNGKLVVSQQMLQHAWPTLVDDVFCLPGI